MSALGRDQIFDRDGYACIICGVKTELTVHHIIPWAITKDNSNRNLMTVCKKCHPQVNYPLIRFRVSKNGHNLDRYLLECKKRGFLVLAEEMHRKEGEATRYFVTYPSSTIYIDNDYEQET